MFELRRWPYMMLISIRFKFSKQLKVWRCCAQNPIEKYKQVGRFDDLKHTGRPKRFSGCEIRHMKRLVNGNSRLSASKIATDLNANLPEPVITRTIQRYLRDHALKYVVKIGKQWLSARHWQQRIVRCKQYLNWTKDDWQKVIFFRQIDVLCIKREKVSAKYGVWRKKNSF